MRTKLSLIVESAEPREVHHFASLSATAADAVQIPIWPTAAVEMLVGGRVKKLPPRVRYPASLRYCQKTAGISTTLPQVTAVRRSLKRSALGAEVISRCFTGTVSRIGGVDLLRRISAETIARHKSAFPFVSYENNDLASGGIYQWKKDGSSIFGNPDSIAALQDSVPQRRLLPV